METAKAWVALISLIITSLLSSGVIPAEGQWRTGLTVAAIIAGAIATWAVPNKSKTIEGGLV